VFDHDQSCVETEILPRGRQTGGRKADEMANAMPGRVELKWLSDEDLKQAVNLQLDEVDPFRKLFEQVLAQLCSHKQFLHPQKH
jgi:hypothetical protein